MLVRANPTEGAALQPFILEFKSCHPLQTYRKNARHCIARETKRYHLLWWPRTRHLSANFLNQADPN